MSGVAVTSLTETAATVLLVSGMDLMVVALLAFACFGLPGIVLLLYAKRRVDD